MFTKMISTMKNVKDRMDNPMPVDQMNQLLDVLKTTGATHIEIAAVIGHKNFASVAKQWADAIHAHGLLVTWRPAHQNMEGLYNQPKFVGAARKSQQFWIDEAVNAFTQIKDSIKTGDEEAIYPERTEGIFSDETSFLSPNSPDNYASFFIALHNALKVFPWTIGLSANNASELLSGWMSKNLINLSGLIVIDHYVDGDSKTYDAQIRSIQIKYGLPVYVQEGAPNRNTVPTRADADAYYAINKKLADDGVLKGFGSWSGWAGNPESIVALDSTGKYILNDNGKSLQAWWSPVVPPPPQSTPAPKNITTINPKGVQVLGNVWLHEVFVDGIYVGKQAILH